LGIGFEVVGAIASRPQGIGLIVDCAQPFIERLRVKPVVIVGTGNPITAGHNKTQIAGCGLSNLPFGGENGCSINQLIGNVVSGITVDNNHMFNIADILGEALIQFHQHPQPVRQQPGGGNHTDSLWNVLTLFLVL
jgi:hypothetical protein